MGISVPGGPVFMGGMWPHGMPPVSPMVPIMHQQSPVNGGGGRGGGRGRQGKHSPRNYLGGGSKGPPHSPSGQQRARGNSYGSGKSSAHQQGMGHQGTAMRSAHAAPVPTDQGDGARGVAFDEMGHPILHVSPGQSSPREGTADEARERVMRGVYMLP